MKKIILATLIALSGSAQAASTWPFVNGDLSNTRSAGAAPSAKEAARLTPVWSFKLNGSVKYATPVADTEALYLPVAPGRLYRFDRATGIPTWDIDLAAVLGVPGANSRSSVAVANGQVIVALRNKPIVAALDAKTGALVWKSITDENPFSQFAQSPIVADGKIFISFTGVSEEALPALRPGYKCCTYRGSTIALDAATGKVQWKTYVLPEGFAGASIWSSALAYDATRRQVYVTTGNAYLAPPDVQACIDKNRGNEKAQRACHPANVFYDSLVAFDADTGAIKWGFRGSHDDFFTAGCLGFNNAPINACGKGPDHDFGGAPMLWRAGGKDFVGAGQKSGVFWALDPDTGKVRWQRSIGPGGPQGGIEFGTATDGKRVYVADSNGKFPTHPAPPNKLPGGKTITYGSLGAFDAATGKLVWHVPDPAGEKYPGTTGACADLGGGGENCAGAYLKAPLTVANGVAYVCSFEPEGHMYAFDARNGKLLWSFKSGSGCETGAAVLDDTVYWANGQTLYAFGAPERAGKFQAQAPVEKKFARVAFEGVFTQAQAERGAVVYRRSCSIGCHQNNFAGKGPVSELNGQTFATHWKGLSLAAYFKKIAYTMPVDKPGTLMDQDYLDVTAYLLSVNGFPAGNAELKGDLAVLDTIAIAER